jgi:hypothetical protein
MSDGATAPTPPTLEALVAMLKASVRDYEDSAYACDTPQLKRFRVERLARADALRWLAGSLPEMMADRARLDFLERGGFTVFQSSERKAANAVDCRDAFKRTPDVGRFYRDTIREAIDAAHEYDNALGSAPPEPSA